MDKDYFMHQVRCCSDPKDSYCRIQMIYEVPYYQRECFISLLRWGLTLPETFKMIKIIDDSVKDQCTLSYNEYFLMLSNMSNVEFIRDGLSKR